MRYIVKSPVKEFTGEIAGVTLVKGQYEGELPLSALYYFQGAGYDVQEVDEQAKPAKPAKATKSAKAPAGSETPRGDAPAGGEDSAAPAPAEGTPGK